MIFRTNIKWYGILFSIIVVLIRCAPNQNFDAPNTLCLDTLVPNITIEELKNTYEDEVFQIQEDLVLEAVVISSDKEGNVFGVIHCQDAYKNPKHGLQIEIDLQDSHLFYPLGATILVKLKGLYLGKRNGIYKIGGVFTAFGNKSVGRLPALSVKQHLFLSCTNTPKLQPTLVAIPEVNDALLNTFLTLKNVAFSEEFIGLPFAEKELKTQRMLEDCKGNELVLLNSGYSNFQSQLIPNNKGSITGFLTRDSKGYLFLINSLEDINFTEQRCEELVDEFTSTSIFISEIADPDNTSSGRYVELYNAGNILVSLKNWKLQRYTNSNTEISSEIDLTGLQLEANSAITIAKNAEDFTTIYGFVPSLNGGSNSPADSNGDDNLVLVDPFGTTIDVFGVLGEDGSGTNHEFEDGRALRKANVFKANPVYTFSEWEITNDTGGNGTTNKPQMAPEDYTPGMHN